MKLKVINTLIVGMAGIFVSATTLLAPPSLNRRFVQETKEDVEQALVNIPERVPSGPEVVTLRGRQITLGDIPSDFLRNKQIYNDIAEYQIQINKLIQAVWSRQNNAFSQNKIEDEIKDLLEILAIGGVRYNEVARFRLWADRVIAIREDLRESYNDYQIANPNNYYMSIRFRLETVMAEIENLLKTKLAR